MCQPQYIVAMEEKNIAIQLRVFGKFQLYMYNTPLCTNNGDHHYQLTIIMYHISLNRMHAL